MRLTQINDLRAKIGGQPGSFAAAIEAFVDEAQTLAADGLTLAELGQLVTALISLAVDKARELVFVAGPEKKQYVLEAVGYLFDRLAPHLPFPWFLQPLRPLLRPLVRRLVLAVADGVIEAVYARQKHVPLFHAEP